MPSGVVLYIVPMSGATLARPVSPTWFGGFVFLLALSKKVGALLLAWAAGLLMLPCRWVAVAKQGWTGQTHHPLTPPHVEETLYLMLLCEQH